MHGFSPAQQAGMHTSTLLEHPVQGSTKQTETLIGAGAGGGQQTGAGAGQQTGAGCGAANMGSQHGSQQSAAQDLLNRPLKQPASAVEAKLTLTSVATQSAAIVLRNIFSPKKKRDFTQS